MMPTIIPANARTPHWNAAQIIGPAFTHDRVHPLEMGEGEKFWPAVSKIDDGYGDRNFMLFSLK